MISRLRGVPVGRSTDGLVLDVGGVGYLVAATPSALGRADSGREVSLETYLHVREDALQLYGFADASERELFVSLLGVSGIGPKVALAVVSSSPAAELRRAIALGDAARFQAIPGIGKKTAERLVVELKEKLALLARAAGPARAKPGASVLELKGSLPDGIEPGGAPTTGLVARDALVELGYSVVEAERVLAGVDPELPAEERVREALRSAA